MDGFFDHTVLDEALRPVGAVAWREQIILFGSVTPEPEGLQGDLELLVSWTGVRGLR